MLRNYIVVALRLVVKNKIFSLINILGISIGLSCCILITLYLQDEFNYEKGFEEHEKIFRINTTWIRDGVSETGPRVSPPIAPALTQALGEIETFTRLLKPLNTEINIVQYKDKLFFEKRAYLVDSTFLDVFSYTLRAGNSATALDAPSTVLISEALAVKVFGDGDPIDEPLIINSGTTADTFRITGVVATPDFPSHADADIYMTMNSDGWGRWVLEQTTWANNNVVESYLKLKHPDGYKSVERKFAQFVETHAGAELRQSGRQKILSLQPLDEIRLYSATHKEDSLESSSITYIYIIGTIGIFILLLACINFMNLTTAKSAQRAGEVGIRKSLGAFKTNLMRQFLGESMIIVTLALLLAFLIVLIALPAFNTVMQKQLSFTQRNLPFILTTTFVIAVITGLLAGSYPAFFLSSLKPTQVLKGKSLSADGSQWLRKGLVVFQFVITITLISSIVIVQRQLRFIQSKSLGFDTDQVIIVPMRTGHAASQYSALKSSFERIKGVKIVSATTSVPSTPLARDWGIYKKGATSDQTVTHDIVTVDADYFKTLGIRMIAGRDFVVGQDNVPSDTLSTNKVVLNMASLKAFDIPLEDAVGATIYFEPGDVRYEFTVVGVVDDFHQFSLHRPIGPMLFTLSGYRNEFPYLAASVNMTAYQDIANDMKKIWDENINDAPFESIFLNENLKTLYAAEARTSKMLTLSTTIALVISCLGLYGLSVYVAQKKTKEIGIRKVVGASSGSIVNMLSKEYIKLVAISFIISVPIGYYSMIQWLDGFAYKISPGITVFLISGAVAFLIAWATISFESFRAAARNPVDTLRAN